MADDRLPSENRADDAGRSAADRARLVRGTASVLVSGVFAGLAGTLAGLFFDAYGVSAPWLVCVRQLIAGLVFLAYILVFERERLRALLADRRDLLVLAAYAAFGFVVNQYAFLLTVEVANSAIATMLQSLELVFILGISCLRGGRRPSGREALGVAFALAGTWLIATKGDFGTLSLPMLGLVFGLAAAVGGAMMAVLPVRILPKYGTPVVVGVSMLASSLVSMPFVRPWESAPALDLAGVALLLAIAVPGTFLVYLLYMQGVSDVGPMRASLLLTSEPLAATASTVLLAGVFFMPAELLGFAFIIAMMLLMT